MKRAAKRPNQRVGNGSTIPAPETRTSTRYFVLDSPKDRPTSDSFRALRRNLPPNVHRLRTRRQVVEGFLAPSKRSIWFAPSDAFISALSASIPEPRGDHRLVLFGQLAREWRDLVHVYFRHVLVQADDVAILPPGQLEEVLADPDCEDLVIAGISKLSSESLVLFRGDLEPIVIPFAWFRDASGSLAPDFSDLAITDFGNTVRLGEFEAAVDAILYEFDADFRRRAKRRQRILDASFGGSLRRLRLQKGLSRADFPGIAEKTVARIERNEVEKPRRGTLEAIAERLNVRVDDIESY